MSQSQPHQPRRPSYLRRLSGYLFPTGNTQPDVAKGKKSVPAQHEDQQPSERSPLLRNPRTFTRPIIPASASDDFLHRPLSSSTVIARPRTRRAATIAAPTYHEPPATEPTSRPRASTSTALIGRPEHYPVAQFPAAMEQPSFLSRAALAITNHLELGDGTSHAHRNAPPPPSYWNEHTHQYYLVRLWDAVNEQAANAKSTVSTNARVVSTEKSMIHHFPELAKGDRLLTRDWVEYVLGVALRHPFCTAEKMGRWEILASSSGARGTWGPW